MAARLELEATGVLGDIQNQKHFELLDGDVTIVVPVQLLPNATPCKFGKQCGSLLEDSSGIAHEAQSFGLFSIKCSG